MNESRLADPVDRIYNICIDAEGDKLSRIAAVLGYENTCPQKVERSDHISERIDGCFARMPARSEGVYWLKAAEWDVLHQLLRRARAYELPS